MKRWKKEIKPELDLSYGFSLGEVANDPLFFVVKAYYYQNQYSIIYYYIEKRGYKMINESFLDYQSLILFSDFGEGNGKLEAFN